MAGLYPTPSASVPTHESTQMDTSTDEADLTEPPKLVRESGSCVHLFQPQAAVQISSPRHVFGFRLSSPPSTASVNALAARLNAALPVPEAAVFHSSSNDRFGAQSPQPPGAPRKSLYNHSVEDDSSAAEEEEEEEESDEEQDHLVPRSLDFSQIQVDISSASSEAPTPRVGELSPHPSSGLSDDEGDEYDGACFNFSAESYPPNDIPSVDSAPASPRTTGYFTSNTYQPHQFGAGAGVPRISNLSRHRVTAPPPDWSPSND